MMYQMSLSTRDNLSICFYFFFRTQSIATIAIYLIVLIQFKLSLLQQQLWNAASAVGLPNLQQQINLTENALHL